MIIEKKPIAMAEMREIIKDLDTEKSKKMLDFTKKFVKIKEEDAKKLRTELEKIDIVKLDSEKIAKIIDILPEDGEDLRKIFVGGDITLNQDETNKILETVKKFTK